MTSGGIQFSPLIYFGGYLKIWLKKKERPNLRPLRFEDKIPPWRSVYRVIYRVFVVRVGVVVVHLFSARRCDLNENAPRRTEREGRGQWGRATGGKWAALQRRPITAHLVGRRGRSYLRAGRGRVNVLQKKKQVKNLFLNLELGLFDCLILILQDFCWIIVDLIRFYSTVSVWLVAFSFHARVPKRSVMAQSKAADADAVTTCDWFFYFFLLRCVSRQLGIWIGMSRTRCITAVALVGPSHVMTHLVAWCDVFSYQMLCCVVRSWGLNTWMVRYLLLASAGFNRLLVIVFLVSIDCGGGVGSSFQSDPFG